MHLCRHQLELAVVVELTDREQRLAGGCAPEGQRLFQLVTLGLGRPVPREQPVGMLRRHAQL